MIIHCIADPSTDCPADIIFVMDESSSVGAYNFQLMKSFVMALVGRLDIDSGHTRVGLATYSTQVDTAQAFNLNSYSSVADVQSAISLLIYGLGRTNTAAALRYVRTTMLTSAAGDRSDVPNVIVVMTDGRSDSVSHTLVSTMSKFMKKLLYLGTDLIAVLAVLFVVVLFGATCSKKPKLRVV